MDFLAKDREKHRNSNTISTIHILSRCTSSYLYEFNTDTGTLIECNSRPALSRCAVTKYNESLYIVGGLRNDTLANVGLVYEIQNKLWIEYGCPVQKAFCEICTLHDKMYVFGGVSSEQQPQNSCSCYDFNAGTWNTLPRMKQFRGAPAVVCYNSSIYLMGGFSSSCNCEVERFDPREGLWSSVGSISIFGVLSSALVKDTVHIVNPYSGKYCEFDPRNLSCTRGLCIPFTGKTWLASMHDKLHIIHDKGIDARSDDNDSWRNLLTLPFEKCPCMIS